MESDPVDDPPMYIYIYINLRIASGVSCNCSQNRFLRFTTVFLNPSFSDTRNNENILRYSKKKENTIEKLMVQYYYHWKPGVPSSPLI